LCVEFGLCHQLVAPAAAIEMDALSPRSPAACRHVTARLTRFLAQSAACHPPSRGSYMYALLKAAAESAPALAAARMTWCWIRLNPCSRSVGAARAPGRPPEGFVPGPITIYEGSAPPGETALCSTVNYCMAIARAPTGTGNAPYSRCVVMDVNCPGSSPLGSTDPHAIEPHAIEPAQRNSRACFSSISHHESVSSLTTRRSP
jgi:hypothetical protein